MGSKLETIQRSFLRCPFGSDFKYHLVRWNIVKQPRTPRGLELFNESLISFFSIPSSGGLQVRSNIQGTFYMILLGVISSMILWDVMLSSNLWLKEFPLATP